MGSALLVLERTVVLLISTVVRGVVIASMSLLSVIVSSLQLLSSALIRGQSIVLLR